MTKEERLDIFKEALKLIRDNNIRDFTKQLLIDADDYFFTKPASSSGKYHPQYALGEGGLARHSIAVAFILDDILRTECYKFTDKEKDLLICSAIVHDIKKYGEDKKRTIKNHPELASKYILEEQERNNIITKEDTKFISDAVISHMGQWGEEKPKTDAQKILHIADCIVSRRWLEVDFNRLVEDNPENYILPFGIHKGEKLGDIDPAYVDFLANKFEGQNHPAAQKAKELLIERQNK